MVMVIDVQKARDRLLKLKKEIDDFLEASKSDREIVILDQTSVGRLSRMDSIQQQKMAEAVTRKRKAELVKIEMTFRRIEEGNYGYCVECDEPIPDGRLKIDPTAERCVRCA